MSIFSPKPRRHEGKVGGLFYFLSLISLSIVTCLLLIFVFSAPQAVLPLSSAALLWHVLFSIAGLVAGLCMQGRISVFIHELKHSIVSNLAGNRAKGMKIEDQSGHFEYTFSKQTSHMNAFISLAPYSFPLFTILSVPVYALLISKEPMAAQAVVSFACGLDLLLNLRDVSPYQTDFSEVRGGFMLGLVYVVLFNLILLISSVILVLSGWRGFLELVKWLFDLAILIAGLWRGQ